MTNEGISEQQSNVLKVALAFGMIATAVGVVSILFSYKKVLDLRTQRATLEQSVSALRTEYDSLVMLKKLMPAGGMANEAGTTSKPDEDDKPQPKKEEIVAAAPVTQPLAAKTTPAQTVPAKQIPVPPVVKAGSAKDVKALEKKGTTTSIVLTYYFRRGDSQALEAALRGLGYTFDRKSFDKNTGFQKSNCVWYGAGVPVAEVKKVVIAMIQSGTTVKGIRRFAPSVKDPSYKRNVIEVGMEAALDNSGARPLSIYEVERGKGFR